MPRLLCHIFIAVATVKDMLRVNARILWFIAPRGEAPGIAHALEGGLVCCRHTAIESV